MPSKFTVTHPDGTVSTRGSKSRLYTHVVVFRVEREHDEAIIQDRIDRNLRGIEQAREDIASGDLAVKSKSWGGRDSGERYNTAYLGESYVGSWVTREDGSQPSYGGPKVEDREQAVKVVEEHIADLESNVRINSDRLAVVRTQPAVRYSVPRWSSSEALATKAAQGEFASNDPHVTVSVVPVDAN